MDRSVDGDLALPPTFLILPPDINSANSSLSSSSSSRLTKESYFFFLEIEVRFLVFLEEYPEEVAPSSIICLFFVFDEAKEVNFFFLVVLIAFGVLTFVGKST